MIRQGGDIDNQLKTLFDALRAPHDVAELPGGPSDGDQDPLFCLLDDDERDILQRRTLEMFVSRCSSGRASLVDSCQPLARVIAEENGAPSDSVDTDPTLGST